MRRHRIRLSDGARHWQKIGREFADEYLQPHEVEAELNDGELAPEIHPHDLRGEVVLEKRRVVLDSRHTSLFGNVVGRCFGWQHGT